MAHPLVSFRLTQQCLLKPLTTGSPLANSTCLQCVAGYSVLSSNSQTPRGGNSDCMNNQRSVTVFSDLLCTKRNAGYSNKLQLKIGSLQRQFHRGSMFQNPEKTADINKSQQAGASDKQRTEEVLDMEQEITENLQQMRKMDFIKARVSHPEELQHFRKDSGGTPPPSPTTENPREPAMSGLKGQVEELPIGAETLPHPIWTEEEVTNVKITHKTPVGFIDKLAYFSVKLLRKSFDLLSGYNRKHRDETVWVNRICFLETVAGVPGMVGAMVRHLHSLRRMRRDHGWIHTLLEEAENERMHLMTALQLKQPGILFRMAVVGAQGCMVTFFSLAYLVSPKYCHRFVGYLEEEAVVTYTKCLQDIESGGLQHWKTQPAPYTAILYWKLSPNATMKDVILAIRADEAHHRVVNHTLGSMKQDDYNPYKPGQ